MPGKRLPYFEDHSEPLAARIATGLHKIGLAMKQQAWQQASEHGLSATQGQILAILVADGALTGTELSERLGLTLPTISDSVRALVSKQLVTKSRDPRHPRASLIQPTKAGKVLGTRARSWPEFMAEAVQGLSVLEQRAFFTGVLKMIRTLQEQGLIPISGMCVTCQHFRPNQHTGDLPHHCSFVDAPIGPHQLRLDCPEHEPSAAEIRQKLWAQFIQTD
jgi:DNA-binding MarR family transcriptional regulator